MADFDKIVKQLEDKNKANKDRGTQLSDQKNVVQSLDAVQNAIVRSIAVLIQTMIEDTQKVEITNHKDQLDTIKTPDAIQGAKMVEYCIKDLQRVVQNKDVDLSGVLTHLEGIHGVLEQLPTKYPEMPEYPQEMAVKGLNDLSKKLDGLVAEVKKLKLDPKIDVSTPEVKIDLSKELKQIEEAIQRIDIVIPQQPETDLTPLLGAMSAVQTAVREIEFPIPNFRGAEIVKQLESIDAKTLPPDSFRIDAFGRERVSNPHTIFDSKMVTDDQPLFYDEIINGTATAEFATGDAAVNMTVLADGDYAIRQTFMRFDYQPAKSQRLFLTGILGTPVLNTESRIGYFNTNFTAPYTGSRDGLYFGTDGTELYVAISHNGVENRIPQSEWNVDKLDGTGESGITIDLDLVQIFTMDFEWLGVGRVRYGFVVDGLIYYCHYQNHANVAGETTVYMSSPNHSVRYEVYSTGGEKHIKHICASVQSEGGVEPSGVTRSISRGISTVARTTSLGGLIFFRLKQTSPCTTVAPDNFSTLCTSNNAANYRYTMILNPIIAGDALTFIPVANSAIEYALAAANNLVSNGEELITGYASGDAPGVFLSTQLIINPGISLNGTQDIFCLAVQTTAGSDNFVGSINLREITCG